MQGWLGKYLAKVGVEEDKFLQAFERIENAGTDQIKRQHLILKYKEGDAAKLLKLIKVQPQNRMFEHIASALSSVQSSPRSLTEIKTDLQDFHAQWQKHMLDRWRPLAEYGSRIEDKIQELNKLNFPFERLEGMRTKDDPATAYARELVSRLESAADNKSPLGKVPDQLLRHCEKQHLPVIAELVSLIAYHFIPAPLWDNRSENTVTIGHDQAVPELYRQIQNWRNDVLSQVCEYVGMEQGVRGAIPVCRTVQTKSDMLESIIARVDKRIDDYSTASPGSDTFTVSNASHSARMLRKLQGRLETEAETEQSQFIYSAKEDSIDAELRASISDTLPSLPCYSHQVEESNDVPEVTDIDVFLSSAGAMIEAKRKSLSEPDPAIAQLHDLIRAVLTETGKAGAMQTAPQPVDRIKYLKWFNEILKSDELISKSFENHPEVKELLKQIGGSVKDISLDVFDHIAQWLS